MYAHTHVVLQFIHNIGYPLLIMLAGVAGLHHWTNSVVEFGY